MTQTDIQQLLDRLAVERQRPDVPVDVDMAISDALAGVEHDLILLESDDGYKQHLMDYVQSEFRNRDSQETICDCTSAACPLKRGILPKAVRYADDIENAIEDFRIHHGYPRVLERAQETWADRRSRVRATVSRCIQAAVRGDKTVLEDDE